MADTYTALESAERRAQFALWAIPGVGPVGIAELTSALPLGELLRLPAGDFAALPGAGRTVGAYLEANGLRGLEPIAQRTLDAVKAARMSCCFEDANEYPALLRGLPDAPPVLFYYGKGAGSGRRTVAMVGSRDVEQDVLLRLGPFAEAVARAGVTIVSGAALGVDTACHRGALAAGGETWAFLGSGLDQIDSGSWKVSKEIVDAGGTVFSEFPPGARAHPQQFPRRNRLISGSSEVTVLMRARVKSGALHTAEYAKKQGRPIFVLVAEHWDERAAGGLDWLGRGASVCWSPASLLSALEISGTGRTSPEAPDLSSLSPVARQAYEAMSRRPQIFEQVQSATGMDAGALVSALCELELSGLVVQLPGKLYERI